MSTIARAGKLCELIIAVDLLKTKLEEWGIGYDELSVEEIDFIFRQFVGELYGKIREIDSYLAEAVEEGDISIEDYKSLEYLVEHIKALLFSIMVEIYKEEEEEGEEWEEDEEVE